MAFAAIREFLKLQGIHYQAPAKAGVLAPESQRVEGTEKNRHDLLQAVADGTVRKVLVKYDISLVEESSLENILDQLQEALVALEPYYLATRQV